MMMMVVVVAAAAVVVVVVVVAVVVVVVVVVMMILCVHLYAVLVSFILYIAFLAPDGICCCFFAHKRRLKVPVHQVSV